MQNASKGLRVVGLEVVDQVPIDTIRNADSPRLEGENVEHVRLLAELDTELPPIVVHRKTMRVIDGMHRLAAAKLRGRETIPVRFFVGSEDDAFVEAVQLNIAHGLPLTLDDRRSAAARIVLAHAEWSDRMIAGIVGLSPKTVGTVRRRTTDESPQLTVRVGRDGRVRRFLGHPQGTRRGQDDESDDPWAPRPRRPTGEHVPSTVTSRSGAEKPIKIYLALRQDPSVRMTEAGRFLLRLLELHLTRRPEWERLLETVPWHRADSVGDLAQECARIWLDFAEQVARRSAESRDET